MSLSIPTPRCPQLKQVINGDELASPTTCGTTGSESALDASSEGSSLASEAGDSASRGAASSGSRLSYSPRLEHEQCHTPLPLLAIKGITETSPSTVQVQHLVSASPTTCSLTFSPEPECLSDCKSLGNSETRLRAHASTDMQSAREVQDGCSTLTTHEFSPLHSVACDACRSTETLQPRRLRHRKLAEEVLQRAGVLGGVGAMHTLTIRSSQADQTSKELIEWVQHNEIRLKDGDWPRRAASNTALGGARLIADVIQRWVAIPICLTRSLSIDSDASRYTGTVVLTLGDDSWLRLLAGPL